MERRGGLCIVRYGAEPDVAWKVGRIMLKYRPIAPKPAAGGAAAPTPALADGSGAARGKRKGDSGRDGRRGRKSRKTLAAAVATAAATSDKITKKVDSPVSPPLSSPSSSSNSYYSSPPPPPPPSVPLQVEQNVVTLPLMPETPDRKEEEKTAAPPRSPPPPPLDVLLPCLPHLWWPETATESAFQRPSSVEVVAPRPVRPAGSWVMLECVEETWRDGEICGSDEQVRRGMNGEEACPAFVSDKYDRVAWVNEAYKKMVAGAEEDEDVRVALVTKGNIPASRAFTCRVRVRYASQHGRGTLAAPCDVWRFDDGSLGWRLDIKAALSLSLL